MIDIFEVGAGGGSIAWCDPSGLLQVGPQSAGAEPGPVCYGRGGEAPTITDANAVLGRLVALLDGDLPLDVAQARLAFEQHLCGTLGLTAEEAAAGVLEIADAKTSDVIREVTIARGRDPRDFRLGGLRWRWAIAGRLHNWRTRHSTSDHPTGTREFFPPWVF